MGPTSVAWRDLVLGAGGPYRIRKVEGWDELPPSRYEKQPRTRGHGAHSSPVWADQRIVTVEGNSWSAADRDQLLDDLQARLTFDGGEEPLAITMAGRTLTANAQLLEAAAILKPREWGIGRFGWIAQWRCPDPFRYGPERSLPTGLPSSGGGLTYPLTYPLNYGPLGATGQLELANEGTAPAAIVFDITGGLDEGFEVSGGGDRLRYPTLVPPRQVITIDTDTGTVVAEGTADRRGELTVADWLLIPARGRLTVQFTSLGGVRDPAAQLLARWKPTYW